MKQRRQLLARSLAIRARLLGLEGVEGVFWVSQRGLVKPSNKSNKPVQFPSQVRRVA